LLTLSAGALVVIAAVYAIAAGAAVSNPGAVTITVHNGTLTTGLGAFSPLTGTMTGTVDASGNISIPEANITFTPFDVAITNPVPATVTITPVANSAFTGTVNPDTGLVTLAGSISANLALPAFGLTACPLGPLTLSLSTANAGGSPYSVATGDATVADNTFVIPAIPDAQPGCGGLEGLINTTLGLPSAPGGASLTLGTQFSPVLQGTTTTTAGATTTTTAGATTTTTAGATTTTTAAPTTTTTIAGGTTTTTTVPAGCKPGWGYGDKNHVHCGPPGLAKKH